MKCWSDTDGWGVLTLICTCWAPFQLDCKDRWSVCVCERVSSAGLSVCCWCACTPAFVWGEEKCRGKCWCRKRFVHKLSQQEATVVSECKKLFCVQFSLSYTSFFYSPSSIHLFISVASSTHDPAAIHSFSSFFLSAERKKPPSGVPGSPLYMHSPMST